MSIVFSINTKRLYILANIVGILFFMMSLTSCTSNRKATIGGVKDEHGCLTAAGYTWSDVRKDCIRVFEEGVIVKDLENTHLGIASYAIFAMDSNQVELFRPEHKQVILSRDDRVWSNQQYKLKYEQGEWKLNKGN